MLSAAPLLVLKISLQSSVQNAMRYSDTRPTRRRALPAGRTPRRDAQKPTREWSKVSGLDSLGVVFLLPGPPLVPRGLPDRALLLVREPLRLVGPQHLRPSNENVTIFILTECLISEGIGGEPRRERERARERERERESERARERGGIPFEMEGSRGGGLLRAIKGY